jgi:tetratricopeptide (TPR) repeat protein
MSRYFAQFGSVFATVFFLVLGNPCWADAGLSPKDLDVLEIEREWEISNHRSSVKLERKGHENFLSNQEYQLYKIISDILNTGNIDQAEEFIDCGAVPYQDLSRAERVDCALRFYNIIQNWSDSWGVLNKEWIRGFLRLIRGVSMMQTYAPSMSQLNAVVADVDAAIPHSELWKLDHMLALSLSADAHLLRAYFLKDEGDIDVAISTYEQAIVVGGAVDVTAAIQTKLAIAYRARRRGLRSDNLRRALDALSGALSTREEHAQPIQLIITQGQVGRVYYEMGDLAEAESRYDEALDSFYLYFGYFFENAQQNNALRRGAPIFADAAYTSIEAGHIERAIETLNRGKALILSLAFNRERTFARDRLAWAQYVGREAEIRALRLARQAIRNFEVQDDDNDVLNGKLWGREEELKRAQRRLEIPEIDERLFRLRQVIYWGRRHLKAPIPSEASWEQQHERLTQQAELEVAQSTFQRAIDRFKASMGRGAERVADVIPEGGAVVMPMLASMGGKILLLTKLGDKLTFDVVTGAKFNDAEIIERFGKPAYLPEDVLLKFGPSYRYFEAFNLQYVLDEEAFESNIGLWHDAIDKVGIQLWSVFVGDIYAGLQRRGITSGSHVFFIPTGMLGLLPLGLAHDLNSNVTLSEMYELSIVPSLEALDAATEASKMRADNRLTLISTAGSAFTDGADVILAKRFGVKNTLQIPKQYAEPAIMLSALNGRSYWHITAHGFFSWDHPQLSGFMGRDFGHSLILKDIFEASTELQTPRLVVLAACESGLFDPTFGGDEAFGLPLAFLKLGAVGILSSLWQVDDLATALLTIKFYDLHLDGKLPPASGLRQAQRWLRTATKREILAYLQDQNLKLHVHQDFYHVVRATLLNEPMGKKNNCFAATARFRKKPGHSTASKNLDLRPFEHPFCWAGFVLTGL